MVGWTERAYNEAHAAIAESSRLRLSILSKDRQIASLQKQLDQTSTATSGAAAATATSEEHAKLKAEHQAVAFSLLALKDELQEVEKKLATALNDLAGKTAEADVLSGGLSVCLRAFT